MNIPHWLLSAKSVAADPAAPLHRRSPLVSRASGIVALLACCLATPARSAENNAANNSPRAVVQQTVDQVVGILATKGLSPPQKRHKIEGIVYARFDFDTLSKLTLGRNWSRLSREQQKQFSDQFKQHLSLTYGKNVETYNGERAIVTDDHADADGDWTVKTKIQRPNAADILVDYRMRKANGRWHVVDVIIEGSSLVANYRSQFQEILENSGPDKLVQLLREKNAKGVPLKRT